MTHLLATVRWKRLMQWRRNRHWQKWHSLARCAANREIKTMETPGGHDGYRNLLFYLPRWDERLGVQRSTSKIPANHIGQV